MMKLLEVLTPTFIYHMQNDWGQRDIINRIKILTKRGSYMINDAIPTKYCKYPSNTLLKQANVLVKVNKSP